MSGLSYIERRVRFLKDPYLPRTRRRVLMAAIRINGTRYNAGTIMNTWAVREFFAQREAAQDLKLDREIARLELMEAGNVGAD